MSKIPKTASLHTLPGIAGTVGLNTNASFRVSLLDGLSGMNGISSPSMRMKTSQKAILDRTMNRLQDDGSGNIRTHQGCDDYIWCTNSGVYKKIQHTNIYENIKKI